MMHASSSEVWAVACPLSRVVVAALQTPSTHARSLEQGLVSSHVARHTLRLHANLGGHSLSGLQGVPDDEVVFAQSPARVQTCPTAHPWLGVQSALQRLSTQRSPRAHGVVSEHACPQSEPYAALQSANVFESGPSTVLVPQAVTLPSSHTRAQEHATRMACAAARRR